MYHTCDCETDVLCLKTVLFSKLYCEMMLQEMYLIRLIDNVNVLQILCLNTSREEQTTDLKY